MYASPWILRRITDIVCKRKFSLLIGVTIYSIVAYYKSSKKLLHQSLVFISGEKRHDAKFVFEFIQELVPVLQRLNSDVEFIYYWTESPSP